jgi:hypothetical protein
MPVVGFLGGASPDGYVSNAAAIHGQDPDRGQMQCRQLEWTMKATIAFLLFPVFGTPALAATFVYVSNADDTVNSFASCKCVSNLDAPQ